MKVQDKLDQLEDLGAEVVVVAFDDPDLLRRTMLADLTVRVPVLVDAERKAYRAWGLVRLPWWQVWLDPQVWRVYLRILRDGGTWRGLGSDTRQMGGDFLVVRDADGTDRVAWARPQQRDDRPPVGELLERVRETS